MRQRDTVNSGTESKNGSVGIAMRRKRKRLLIFSLGLLSLFIIFLIKGNFTESLIYETVTRLVCDEKHGKQVLNELCKSYDKGKVTGNVCADLCKTNQLIIEQCLSHKNDNVIFSAKWRKQMIILKAKKMSSHSSWDEVFSDISKQEIAVLHKFFLTVAYDHVMAQLFDLKDIKNDTLSLSELPPNKFLARLHFNASVTNLTRTEMQSIWMLLRQDEYYLMQLLQGFKHIPQIYGTCGQFYALEKVQTLSDFVGVGLISAPVSWEVRVKLALQMLDVIQELDSKKDSGFTWQHCDIQPSNFGVNKDGIVKAIDVDLMFTTEKILEILGQQESNCSSHKDCEFFDCASLCDVKSKKCTSVKISNNLQVVCRDLFQSKWYEGGLLTNVPSQSKTKFNKILNECAAATNMPWTKRKYYKIFNTLKRYLSEERVANV